MPSTVPTRAELPPDYLERVYAGVLGKVIGVYLGRPFEMWSHQKIMEKLGPIKYYVNEQLKVPVVVVDDDVSGTFAFVRALEEHDPRTLSSEDIGNTWLNAVAEHKNVFWWGGYGVSTEHTAYLNLKHGIAAPASGSIAVNGQAVAEQIGAQIFIDGWALVSPGRPSQAAHLAETAGKVSHDGESVNAAILWAAMEAEAFVSHDINHLLDTGLSYIPSDSFIARVIGEVRAWVKEDGDWLKTRQRIEDKYGYDKFPGHCHIIPNHCIMVMSILYAENDFSRAMEIINTAGWDTDCNSGNVGCLMAIMLGMEAFATGPDWRGPIADRAIISTTDSGYSINNAARIAQDITNMGRRLAGKGPLPPPKNGAQYHFTLPGSTQGFQVTAGKGTAAQATTEHGSGLGVTLATGETVEVMTQTSTPKELLNMPPPFTYFMYNSPLVYSGQRIRAVVRASKGELSEPAEVRVRLQVFNADDDLVPLDSEPITLSPGDDMRVIEWTVPDIAHAYPIAEAGITVTSAAGGKVWLDSFGWSGCPDLTLQRPTTPLPHKVWDLSWVQGSSNFQSYFKNTIFIAQDKGEGLVAYGTREWTDYKVTVNELLIKLGTGGVAIRVQGLRRWYAVVFTPGRMSLVKARDNVRTELATTEFTWAFDEKYQVSIQARGFTITASVGETTVTATDDEYADGAMGFVINSGCLHTAAIRIQPVQ